MQGDHEIDFGGTKTLHCLDNAIVTPTVVNWERKTFTGCAYDQTGRLVTASQRTRRRVEWTPEDPDHIDEAVAADEVGGRCLYLGHYTGHYGHFLLETLSRFWVLRGEHRYDKFIFQPFVLPALSPQSFSPAKVCFECFGIEPDRVLIVNGGLRFEQLAVPTALFEINNKADEEQALIYRQIGDYCEDVYGKRGGLMLRLRPSRLLRPSKPLRLYLSREKLKGFRPVTNENEVEKVFTSFGFTVIYPEQLSFERQVMMYKRAEAMAGFAGSAMHNSVFMKAEALVIEIGDLRRPDGSNRNQQLCDGFSKVQSAFIRFEGVIDQGGKVGAFDTRHLRDELEHLL